MIGCGTAAFTDPEDFRVNVPGMNLNLVLTAPCSFKARVTWINTRRLSLVRCVESAPRIAFIGPKPGPVFTSFPLRYEPPPVWSGIQMRPGEIVLHGPDDYICQSTRGAARWGLLWVAPGHLAHFSRTLTLATISQPRAAKILRPSSRLVANLLRLHGQACRLAETNPEMIAHREVTRAIEEDLLQALVNCLTGKDADHGANAMQHRAEIIARLENFLASDRAQPSMPEIIAAIGLPERTLRKHCEVFLGMSPTQYARLRRLKALGKSPDGAGFLNSAGSKWPIGRSLGRRLRLLSEFLAS
jgi:AraC-like DNA-binding protein